MDNQNPQTYGGTLSADQIDVGLRDYMMRVYALMAAGVAFTGVVSYYIATNVTLFNTLVASPLQWVFIAAWLGMGFFSNRLFFSQNALLGQFVFWGFAFCGSVLTAGQIAPFLAGYGGGIETIARAFVYAGVMFTATSLFGYVTKRDMSGLGQFFFMAVIGVIVAGFANYFFFQSSGFAFYLSIGVVVLFAAITAYETQQIKHMYRAGANAGLNNQAAVFGSYLLYGSFIVIFWHLLNILGVLSND